MNRRTFSPNPRTRGKSHHTYHTYGAVKSESYRYGGDLLWCASHEAIVSPAVCRKTEVDLANEERCLKKNCIFHREL